MTPEPGEITLLLRRCGNPADEECGMSPRLYELVEPELRRAARSRMRRNCPEPLLQTTILHQRCLRAPGAARRPARQPGPRPVREPSPLLSRRHARHAQPARGHRPLALAATRRLDGRGRAARRLAGPRRRPTCETRGAFLLTIDEGPAAELAKVNSATPPMRSSCATSAIRSWTSPARRSAA